tara:strand:+ start:194 stop:415 length:222 start_codon:yes stop_codon:yes gene_type:complete
MNNVEIKFYQQDAGYNTGIDDSSVKITIDDTYVSEKSLTKIIDAVAFSDVHDAMGLERVEVNYWQNLEVFRKD